MQWTLDPTARLWIGPGGVQLPAFAGGEDPPPADQDNEPPEAEQQDQGDDDSDEPAKLSDRDARRLRKENEARRKENEALRKEVDGLKGFRSSLAKALGVEKADDDPDTLRKAIDEERSQRGRLAEENRRLKLERAVHTVAGKEKVDPTMTWSYLYAQNHLQDLDPADDSFVERISELVKDAVKQYPNLKAGQSPPRGGNDLRGGGTDDRGRPKDRAEAYARERAKLGLVPNAR